jgi:hypothetical protein
VVVFLKLASVDLPMHMVSTRTMDANGPAPSATSLHLVEAAFSLQFNGNMRFGDGGGGGGGLRGLRVEGLARMWTQCWM